MLKWLSSKLKKRVNVGEDTEKRKTLHTAPEIPVLLAHCSLVHKAKAQAAGVKAGEQIKKMCTDTQDQPTFRGEPPHLQKHK